MGHCYAGVDGPRLERTTLTKGGEKRMKRIVKLALVVLPALLLAATVGLSTMGCDDDTSSNVMPDFSVPPDLTTKGG
jgi:hypothetical protein